MAKMEVCPRGGLREWRRGSLQMREVQQMREVHQMSMKEQRVEVEERLQPRLLRAAAGG